MMSFKRKKQDDLIWNDWLNANHDILIGHGIPHCLIDDRGSWLYFLDHGYFTPEGSASPVIDVDQMPEDEMLRLCVFLEADTY